MMRKIIEYLRRKQNITIEDLVVEICSSTMYYKYLSKEKNMSTKNLKLIKERLGADDLTKEEISEYHHDLDKIIHKIMRYYPSKEAFSKDILPLIELEPQLLLCDDLCIDYIIAKINYLLLENNVDEISNLLPLLEQFFLQMTITQKLFYYQLVTFKANYLKEDITSITEEFAILLENNKYNKDYGKFHMSIVYSYIFLKNREKALLSLETALSLFIRDLNLIGQVKATNMKAVILGESRKYEEVINLLIPNYNNAKQINASYEVFVSLTNLITCYFGLNDLKGVTKYWNYFKKQILNTHDYKLLQFVLKNNSLSLFTNFDYFDMQTQLDELIELFKKYEISDNKVISYLIEYYEIKNMDDKIKFIENTFLSLITGKAHFTYCKWMLDRCVNYFYNKRMYKKSIDLEAKYLELFKQYYFN